MDKFLYFFLFLILSEIRCQDGSNLKSRAVTRWNNYVSGLLNEEQLIGLFDKAIGMAYDGEDVSTIGNALVDYLMDSLSTAQFTKFTNFGFGLIFYYKGGISGFIDALETHISNNLSPFITQLQNEMKLMKEKGEEKQYIFNQSYYMALTMFTPEKIKNIICRFEKKFTPAEWQKISTNLVNYNIIKLDIYKDKCA